MNEINFYTNKTVCLNPKFVSNLSAGLVQIPVSMYQTVVTSLAQGNRPVQVAMAPVATRIDNTVTLDGQAVEVVTLEQWHLWPRKKQHALDGHSGDLVIGHHAMYDVNNIFKCTSAETVKWIIIVFTM